MTSASWQLAPRELIPADLAIADCDSIGKRTSRINALKMLASPPARCRFITAGRIYIGQSFEVSLILTPIMHETAVSPAVLSGVRSVRDLVGSKSILCTSADSEHENVCAADREDSPISFAPQSHTLFAQLEGELSVLR